MRKRSIGIGLLAAAAIVAMVNSSSFAQGTFYVVTADSRLGTVSVADGSYTNIGDLGVPLTDIAVASDGSLFGVSFFNLYSINALTGATTLIGATGRNDFNALVFRDNTLYAAGSNNTGLYTLDTLTGASTLIGDTGFNSAGDLAFDEAGTLYLSSLTDRLVRVDPVTGAGMEVGPFGGNFGFMFGIAFQPSSLTLYGFSSTANQVVTIDRTTGAATAVANNQGPQINGTAFIGEATVTALEPGTLTLALLGMTSFGIFRRRR